MTKKPKEPSESQLAILKLLADGNRHSKHEIHALLYDELDSIEYIQHHLSVLRLWLAPKGETIICEFANRRTFYRHVRLLPQASQG